MIDAPRIYTPRIYTTRFFNTELLTSGELVPVDVAFRPPTIPLPYGASLERMETLAPYPEHIGEFRPMMKGLRHKWERIGVEAIARELREISDRHGGKPLALCCWEDVQRGHECTRLIFSEWWERRTGRPVFELTADGREIPWSGLHKQARVPRPRAIQPVLAQPIAPWPWTEGDFGRFVRSVEWRFARTMPSNPHEYCLSRTTSRENFELAVLHIRENGYESEYAGRVYTQLDHGPHFYFTMGSDLCSCILINRKLHDPTAQKRLRERMMVKKGKGRA